MLIPTNLPIGLTNEFAIDPSRQTMWLTFLKKNQLTDTPLLEVVTLLRTALRPALDQAAALSSAADKTDN